MAQSGNAVAEMIGPLLAGVLVTAMSLEGILFIDALSFLVSMAALIAANIPRPESAAGHGREGLLREAAIGWRYVQERPGLVGLLAMHSLNNFVFSVARVVIAPLLLSFSDPGGLGVQYAISGGGLLLGGIGVTLWGAPQKRIYGVLIFSLLAGICTGGARHPAVVHFDCGRGLSSVSHVAGDCRIKQLNLAGQSAGRLARPLLRNPENDILCVNRMRLFPGRSARPASV